MRTLACSFALVLLGSACSNGAGTDTSTGLGTSTGTDTTTTTTTTSESESSSESTGSTDTSGTETSGEPKLDMPMDEELPPGCVQEAADYMFLLDNLGGLYRFDPEALTLESLGPLACPGATAAMGLTIDRGGTLWALMLDDTSERLLFTVDPETLTCELTAFVDPLAMGFAAYAIAFGADAVDSQDETLYLAGLASADLNPSPDAPPVLARVDLNSFTVETLGTLPLPNSPGYELCDLKGSGDARLWAFCSTEPAATLAELDEADASLIVAEPLDLVIGSSGAFGLWEGDMWLFTATGPEGRSQVSRHTFGGGSPSLVLDDIGFVVVGAANSTCVPYEPVG